MIMTWQQPAIAKRTDAAGDPPAEHAYGLQEEKVPSAAAQAAMRRWKS
jgi:hypothetical protein